MRKLKLRKRISNFPKATQLVSDLKLSLSAKILLSFKTNCLKWNTSPCVVFVFCFFPAGFPPLLIWALVSTVKEKLGCSRGFDCLA